MRKAARDGVGADLRSRMRGGLGIAGVILCLVVGTGVILLFTGLWKRFARETIPIFVRLPGSPWALGAALGLITVLGAIGALRRPSEIPSGNPLVRGLSRAVGTTVCCAAAFGPFFYLLSGLPAKNCRSVSCAYVPGTGIAFLAYGVSAGLAGWYAYRWTSARAAAQLTMDRERARRLRKKGKGKSRAARGR